nr:pre-mRNA-splicing factor ISY1 homolog [Loxodonta africana]
MNPDKFPHCCTQRRRLLPRLVVNARKLAFIIARVKPALPATEPGKTSRSISQVWVYAPSPRVNGKKKRYFKHWHFSFSFQARNAEKAMTALARFRQAQLEEGKVKERRPFLASECTELPKAEKWRRQIIGEISKKVAQIQNDRRCQHSLIDFLFFPPNKKVGPKMLDHEGKEVPGNRGYKYFGAAKDLPGVRELFEKEPLPPPRKTRAELMKAIDFEYYGYLDEDDGVIVPLEQEYEKKLRAELVEKWKTEREARLARGEKEEEEEEEEEINIYAVNEEESDEEGGQEKGGEDGQQKFIAHVPVPSQQEIEEALVRRKKMELLQKYASETLQAQSEEAKRLLGY